MSNLLEPGISQALQVSCFYPRRLVNRAYRGLSGDRLKFIRSHARDYYLSVPCGKCVLCRKKRATEWHFRLDQEAKKTDYKNILFVLFTFNEQNLEYGEKHLDVLIRRWRQNWTHSFGVAPRYFAVTDKGHKKARLHLHLLIFNPQYRVITKGPRGGRKFTGDPRPLSINSILGDNEMFEFVKEIHGPACWDSGFVSMSWAQGPRAVGYVCNYITTSNLEKEAKKHGEPICPEALQYIPKIFVSKGLGSDYMKNASFHTSNESKVVRMSSTTLALPSYYANKMFSRYKLKQMRWQYEDNENNYLLTHPILRKYSFRGQLYNFQDIEQMRYNSLKYDSPEVISSRKLQIFDSILNHNFNNEFEFKQLNLYEQLFEHSQALSEVSNAYAQIELR